MAQQRAFYDAETERLLSCELEGPAHKVLNALRTSRTALTPDERIRFAMYIATMLTRVPRNRRRGEELAPRVLNDTLADIAREVDELEARGANPVLVSRWRQEIEKAGVRLREKLPDDVVKRIVSPWPTPKMVACIFQMTWRVLRSAGPQYFVTSDNPAFFFEAYGLGRPESELSFPLCPELALAGSRQGQSGATIFLTAKQVGVREMNRRIVAGAERFVYCHEQQSWIDIVAQKPRPYLSRVIW